MAQTGTVSIDEAIAALSTALVTMQDQEIVRSQELTNLRNNIAQQTGALKFARQYRQMMIDAAQAEEEQTDGVQ